MKRPSQLVLGIGTLCVLLAGAFWIWGRLAEPKYDWSKPEDPEITSKVVAILSRWSTGEYEVVYFGGATGSEAQQFAMVVFFETHGDGLLCVHIPSAEYADSMDVRFSIWTDKSTGSSASNPNALSASIKTDSILRATFADLLDELETSESNGRANWSWMTGFAKEPHQWQNQSVVRSADNASSSLRSDGLDVALAHL